ncbi:MAG TPA: Gfo/Idh/MocA family oxidoreductase, partial [Polyangiaceae bacterium]
MSQPKVRFAVIGQGFFAQSAILPAFRQVKNAELAALVSSDPTKLDELAKRYRVEETVRYEDFDLLLKRGSIDAVYIALPNSLHAEYACRAAAAGVHVLCEKPMAPSVDDCRKMMHCCDRANVKLMVGYRLHFEAANLEAIEIARSGKLGTVRAFTSTLTAQVRPGNIRLQADKGGGPLFALGTHAINAARSVFHDDPTEVFAFSARMPGDPRFAEVNEQVSLVLRFPDERLANILVSFGASECSKYEIVGTEGRLLVDPAYDFDSALKHDLVLGAKHQTRTFSKRDQIAPEIAYFADCILNDEEPEPSGEEGLVDVRVVEGAFESIRTGRTVQLAPSTKTKRPTAA